MSLPGMASTGHVVREMSKCYNGTELCMVFTMFLYTKISTSMKLALKNELVCSWET
jgi:hypothetical protein